MEPTAPYYALYSYKVMGSERFDLLGTWFQGKLPFTFNLPELQGSLYKLDGGKLVYFRNQPGAQLIYELRKHELSVFIVHDDGLSGTGDGVWAGNQNGSRPFGRL